MVLVSGTGTIPTVEIEISGTGTIPTVEIEISGTGTIPTVEIDISGTGTIPTVEIYLAPALFQLWRYIDPWKNRPRELRYSPSYPVRYIHRCSINSVAGGLLMVVARFAQTVLES